MMEKTKQLCAIINLTEDTQALKPLTNNRPVAGLPFASRYRIIDFQLSNIAHADIDSVGLFISGSGRSIYDHARSGTSWYFDNDISGGVFTFSQRDWKAAHHLEEQHEDFYYDYRLFLSRSRAEHVFVSGSSIIANLDIQAALRFHTEHDADITFVYKTNPREALSQELSKARAVVFDDEGEVEKFMPYDDLNGEEMVRASMGMYLISVDTMLEIIRRAMKDEVYLELDDLIERYILDYQARGYEYTGYLATIDSVKSYYDANMALLDRANFNSLLYASNPVLTKTKNGVPAYYAPTSKVTDSIIATGVHLEGEVDHSIVYRKVNVAKDAVIKNSILLQGVTVEEGAQIEYAILDKKCVVKAGARIIGNPDNPVVISKNTIVASQEGD